MNKRKIEDFQQKTKKKKKNFEDPSLVVDNFLRERNRSPTKSKETGRNLHAQYTTNHFLESPKQLARVLQSLWILSA